MTRQEIETYIAIHGNGRQVIDTLKEMNAEGINLATVTESQLTARLNQSILGVLDNGTQYSYESSQSLQPYNQPMYSNPGYSNNINISNQFTATGGRKNSINKHVFVWVCCFLFGCLGVDRFMRGQILLGIFKLLFGWWITLGIWPIVDWIIAMVKAYGNAYGAYDEITFINGGYSQ